MTWIRIDPDEMTATATALQSVAGEISTIGGEVQSQCGSCCVPVDVEAQVLGSVSAIDAGLGSLSSDLAAWANDLANRGALAASGSLPTAASSASGAGSSADGFGGTTGYLAGQATLMGAPVGGGFNSLTTGYVAGQATLMGAPVGGGFNSLTTGYLAGQATPITATFGGGFGGLTTGWVGGMASTTGTIGGGTMVSSGYFHGDLATANIDFNAQSIRNILEPSRSELMHQQGSYMSPTDYTNRGYRGLN